MQTLNQETVKGYELKECLGEGAYGAVYRATQPQVGREVAIKIILPEYANRPEFIRRFETEAQLVAQLEHMNIVPLYDYWREPDGAYLVMRLMKGGSLADSLRENGPWEPLEAVRLVDQIGAALEAAHQQGVVHRDLKPANILLDENGNAYLSDFGIAKELGDKAGLTQTGVIVGTPAYITPEQVQSQAVTPQTDIYALGVMLYELLTGVHPFAELSTGELVVKQLSEPLPYVREVRPELSAAVDGVIQRATSKKPERRYPDALSLAADLRAALGMKVELPEVHLDEIYNPYKGLRAFQEADAEDFFGREALTGKLLARLVEPEGGGRFLAVVGPSGSGKSSVVKAGLIPALRKGALPGSDQWFIVDMLPKAHPLRELSVNLGRICAKPNVNVTGQLERDARGLVRAGRRVLPSNDGELLVVVDQFEELFTLVEDETETRHLMDLIYTAVTDPHSQVRVIITLRADFYDRPLMYPDFSRLVEAHTALVLPLTPEELEQAIRAPAERVGVVFEKGLVSAIIVDIADQPGALPLLQYALTEMFEHREGRMLTSKAYQAIGGVLGALGRRAEEVYEGLAAEAKECTRQLFLRLVALGEGTEDTRSRVLRAELEGLSSGQGLGDWEQGAVISDQYSVISGVLDTFGQARLLTFDHDPVTRRATVEVAHEALLREWRRLQEWLDASRVDVHMQRVLGNAAAEWLGADRETSFLLRGTRLAQFEDWVEGSTVALTTLEQTYLKASLEAKRARQAAEAERRQRELEQVSIGLAAQALQEIEGSSPERSVLLALEALEQYPYTWQAEHALSQVVLKSRLRMVLNHEDHVMTAQWSADGARILSCGEDKTLRVWDALGGEELWCISEGAPVLASWSPDEKSILAINNEENIVKVWETATGLTRLTLDKRDIEGSLKINSNDWNPWSPDGDRFLIYSKEGTLQIWDAQSGKTLHTLSEHNGWISEAMWSPSGDLIVTSGFEDGMVILWQAESGEIVHRISVDFEDEKVFVGGWSPDGKQFATRGMGGAKVYDTNTGRQLLDLSVPGVKVFRVIWSPDGTRILTSGRDDGTARVWDAESGQEQSRLAGLVWATGSDWSPVEDLVAVGGHDSIVHIWDMVTGQEVTKLSGTTQPGYLAFSPGGERLLAVGYSHNVNIYNLSEACINISITTHGGISLPAWSPGGEQLAFGTGFSANYSLKIWDVASGQLIMDLSDQIGAPGYFAWSPSGDRFLSTDEENNTELIWDSTTYELLLTIPGPEDKAGSWLFADWSPDGNQIAVNSYDPTVVVWDTSTGDEISTFSGHQDQVYGIAWSPDGTRILSNGTNGEAMIWGAANGQLLLNLFPESYNLIVSQGAWTKDGRWVVILSADGIVTIFDAQTGEQRSQFLTTSSASNITNFSLSPSDERVIIGGHDGIARVWDLASGTQLLGYEVGGYCAPAYSPDGRRAAIGTTEGNEGKLLVYPTWHSAEELIAYARERCVFRDLTAEERQLFGLPER